MQAAAVFPGAPQRAGMYESFYLRAVAPDEPVGVWLRYTVHKRPGRAAAGIGVVHGVRRAARGRPWMHKLTSEELRAPGRRRGSRSATRRLGDGYARGECGGARWSLRMRADAPELQTPAARWMYRAPLPRTKLTSPSPSARFEGTLALGTGARWSWTGGGGWSATTGARSTPRAGSGCTAWASRSSPSAWLDVALGRIELAGRLTPWVASGAIEIAGERQRIGGLGARGLRVRESTEGCELSMPGPRGLRVDARVAVPSASSAGWRYADPGGGEHEVANCSVARVELDVRLPGGRGARTLTSAHGGAYELGMRAGRAGERPAHDVPIAPFADG